MRRFRASGPAGVGVYAFCVPPDGRMHLASDRPDPEPAPEAGSARPRRFVRGVESVPSDPRAAELLAPLSLPEIEVLRAAARGLTVVETADALGKGAETVKSQRNRIVLKLGARNMTHAVCMAAERGLVGAR